MLQCLTHLMQVSYFRRYFPKPGTKENRIYVKNLDKGSCHLESYYRSMSLSNILGKIYERTILHQAANVLEESNFFKGKTQYAFQKNKRCLTGSVLCSVPNKCKRGLQVANVTLKFSLICRMLLMQCGGMGHYIRSTKQV